MRRKIQVLIWFLIGFVVIILAARAFAGTRPLQADRVNIYGVSGRLASYSEVHYRQPEENCIDIILEDREIRYINCNIEIIEEGEE